MPRGGSKISFKNLTGTYRKALSYTYIRVSVGWKFEVSTNYISVQGIQTEHDFDDVSFQPLAFMLVNHIGR
jgi:hypothetical protein